MKGLRRPPSLFGLRPDESMLARLVWPRQNKAREGSRGEV